MHLKYSVQVRVSIFNGGTETWTCNKGVKLSPNNDFIAIVCNGPYVRFILNNFLPDFIINQHAFHKDGCANRDENIFYSLDVV